MNPTKLPSGSWRLKVYLGKDANGKRIYQSVTHVNKRECIRIANDLAQHHHEITRNPAAMTLCEAIDAYIALKDNLLSPATIRGYETVKKHHFRLEMDMPLHKITNNIIQAAVNREAMEYSPKTVINAYGLISTVIRQFSRIELSVTLPRKQRKKINLLTKDQLGRIVKASVGERAENAILAAMFLGLRDSEIVAIRPEDDYNIDTKVITIRRAIVYDRDNKLVEKGTKSEAGERSIIVPDYLANKLELCIREGTPFCDIPPNHLSRHLRRICEKAGVPGMRMHDLRHQNASIMLLYAPDKYAMERGGWSTNYVMKNIYQHTMSDARIEMDHKINEYFDALT